MKKLLLGCLLQSAFLILASDGAEKVTISFNKEQTRVKINKTFGGVFTDSDCENIIGTLVGQEFTVVACAQVLDVALNRVRDSKMESLKGGPAKAFHNRVNSSKEQLLDDLLSSFSQVDNQDRLSAKKILSTQLWK